MKTETRMTVETKEGQIKKLLTITNLHLHQCSNVGHTLKFM